MNMPNRKRPSDNAEEETTSGFLFDYSFDICTSGVLLDEVRLSVTMTQFQPASDSE